MSGLIARLRFFVSLLLITLGFVYSKDAHALTWLSPAIQLTPEGYGSDLAVDPTGNAFTIYVDQNSTNGIAVARFSSLTGTYSAPVTLYTNLLVSLGLEDPVIATDATQTALGLWQDLDTNSLYAAFFNGTAWQPYVVLDNNIDNDPMVGFSAEVQVAMDGSGNGLAVWRNQTGSTPPGDIRASFFNAGTQTWNAFQTLTPAGTGGNAPAVAYSSNGTAVAIWLDDLNNVVASNYNGSTWTALPGIISAAPAAFGALQVGIDSAGNAVAIWSDMGTSEVFSSTYNAGTWSAPQSVSQSIGVSTFDFAMSPNDTAVATWVDASNVAQYSMYTAGTWSAPTPYQSDVFNVSTAIDTVGNILLMARTVGGDNFSYTLPVGGPLSSADFIGTDSDVSIGVGGAGYSDNGRGFLSGVVPIGEGSFITVTFTNLPIPPPPPPPPSSGTISGKVCKNSFAYASERVKTITWVPISNPLTVSYYVRRNGRLVAVVPASGPFKYVDQRRCKKTDVYVVTSVDAAGVESNPLTVSIR